MAERSPDQQGRTGSRLRSVPVHGTRRDRRQHQHKHQQVRVPEGFRNPLAPVADPSPPVLLPLIGLDDDITLSLEQALHPVAVRAQDGDRAARDALYTAFEPKLMRFARRIRVPFAPGGAKGLWDRDDVVQETYLVFTAVVGNWPPAIPFGRYLLAHFPWRLRDAVHRGVGRRSVPPRTFGVPIESGTSDMVADMSTVAAEQRALLAALAASLAPPLDEVLRLHIIDGLSLTETANRTGVSRRTVTRHWRTIVTGLRAGMRAPEDALGGGRPSGR